MNLATFAGALSWVMAHGYLLIFLAMFVEGPTVTAAAAFASVLGYFNVFIIFLLSILGDVTADIAYYALGYYGRLPLVNKFGHYFGLPESRMQRLESHLLQHSVKTLIVLKATPVLVVPGLMLVGAARMPFKKFVAWITLITLPKALLFTIIGYYFGYMYDSIFSHYLKDGAIIIFSALVFLVIYFIYKRVVSRMADKIEKI